MGFLVWDLVFKFRFRADSDSFLGPNYFQTTLYGFVSGLIKLRSILRAVEGGGCVPWRSREGASATGYEPVQAYYIILPPLPLQQNLTFQEKYRCMACIVCIILVPRRTMILTTAKRRNRPRTSL